MFFRLWRDNRYKNENMIKNNVVKMTTLTLNHSLKRQGNKAMPEAQGQESMRRPLLIAPLWPKKNVMNQIFGTAAPKAMIWN